jgi:uroporphyrinogen-III synthase
MTAVWVTRPEPGNAVTSAALHSAGFTVIGLPVLDVRPVAPAGGLPSQPPDWIVFVSANAVRGMEAAGLPSGFRSGVRAAAVGSRTALEAAGHGWNVELVPKSENAEGLLEALSRVDVNGRRVWIPGGSREGSARQLLPEALRARGALVTTLAVYETLDRKLGPEDLARLDAAEPGFIVFHSPSAVDAVFSAVTPEAVGRWKRAYLVAIGPATSDRCRWARAQRTVVCPEPSDAAVVAVITSITECLEEGKRV